MAGHITSISVHDAEGLHARAYTATGTSTHWLHIGFGGQFNIAVFTDTIEEAQAYADAINAARDARQVASDTGAA